MSPHLYGQSICNKGIGSEEKADFSINGAEKNQIVTQIVACKRLTGPFS